MSLPMHDDDGGFVYFALVRDVAKIGHTRGRIEDRLRGVRAEYQCPVRFLGAMPGTRDDEKAMHKRFAHLRETDRFPHEATEIFRLNRELLEVIAQTPIKSLETEDFGISARTGLNAGSSEAMYRLRAYDPVEWTRLIRSAMKRAGNRLDDAATLLGMSGTTLAGWIDGDERLEDLRNAPPAPPPFREPLLRLVGDRLPRDGGDGIWRKRIVIDTLKDIITALESVNEEIPAYGSGVVEPEQGAGSKYYVPPRGT